MRATGKTIGGALCRRELAIALAGVLAGMGMLAAPVVQAQAPPPASTAGTPPTGQDTGDDNDNDNDVRRIDAITVTAQRREQAVQDVPIALQVIDRRLIEDTVAEDIGDLDSFVPGLDVSDSQPTQPSISLRGITTRDFGIGTDAAVGLYVDGVYAGRGAGVVLPFLDVERIEVIKGPQGTLFGRNTAAGALSIVTRAPTSRNEGRLGLRLGDDDKRVVTAMANLAIGEDSALRFNGVVDRADGWLRDAETGRALNPEDEWAGRLSFRTRFGDATRLRVSWDHENLDQRGRPVTGIVALPATPGLPPLPVDDTALLDPRGRATVSDVVDGNETREYDGVRLIVEHDFAWGRLTATSGWHDYVSYNRIEEDGTNRRNLYLDTTNAEDNRGFYQDLRFEGEAGRFDWVAGVNHYREDGRQSSSVGVYTDTIDTLLRTVGGAPTPDGTLYAFFDQVLQANGIPLTLLGHRWDERVFNTLDTRAYALYGDVIWRANDRLNVTFGLRWSQDRKAFSWLNTTRDAPTLDATLDQLDALGFFALAGVPREAFVFDAIFVDPPALGAKNVRVHERGRWRDLSPRVVVDYHFNDDLMGYASLAKGYKAGGFNAVQIGSAFDNEDVWNAEIGLKHTLPAHGLRYGVSLFHYRYDDRQAIRLDTGAAVPRYVVDTADLQAWGVDADLYWQANDWLGFDLDAAYLDSRYRRYTNPDGQDLDGQATGAPRWTFAAGIDLRRTFARTGTWSASLRHSHRGATRCNDESIGQGACSPSSTLDLGESRDRTDLRLGWRSIDRHWRIDVYGQNLSDRRYVEGLANLGRPLGVAGASVSEPRRYGVEVEVGF